MAIGGIAADERPRFRVNILWALDRTRLIRRSTDQVASVHGAKWHDFDGNGRWNYYEPGLAGWTIRLEASNGTMATTVTDENGRYTFTDLSGGVYTVTEVFRRGWQRTWPPAESYKVNLDNRQTIDGLELGNRLEPVDGIRGIKWFDENGDGLRDLDEPGMAGWTIRVERSNNIMSTTVTGEHGLYRIVNLPAGTYTITELLAPGWDQTFPGDGMHVVDLEPGKTVDWTEFGSWRPPAMERYIIYLPVVTNSP